MTSKFSSGTHHSSKPSSGIHSSPPSTILINLSHVVPEGIILTPTMLQKLKYFSKNDYNQNKELLFNGCLSKEWNGKEDVYRILLGPSNEDGAVPVKIFCRNSLDEMEFDCENERDPFVELNFKHCNPSKLVNYETFLPIQMQVCYDEGCLHVSGELILPSTQYILNSIGPLEMTSPNGVKKTNIQSSKVFPNLKLAPSTLSHFLMNRNRAHQIASGYLTVDQQNIYVFKENDSIGLQSTLDGVWISGVDISIANHLQYIWAVFTRYRHARLTKRDPSKFFVVIFPHPATDYPHVYLAQSLLQDGEESSDSDNFSIFPCSISTPNDQEIIGSILMKFENIQEEDLSPDVAIGAYSSEGGKESIDGIVHDEHPTTTDEYNINNEIPRNERTARNAGATFHRDIYIPLASQTESVQSYKNIVSNQKIEHKQSTQPNTYDGAGYTNQIIGEQTSFQEGESKAQNEFGNRYSAHHDDNLEGSRDLTSLQSREDIQKLQNEQMQQTILIQQLLQTVTSLQLELRDMKKLISAQSNNQNHLSEQVENLMQSVNQYFSQNAKNQAQTRSVGVEAGEAKETPVKQRGPQYHEIKTYSHGQNYQNHVRSYNTPVHYQNHQYNASGVFTPPEALDPQRYFMPMQHVLGAPHFSSPMYPIQDPSRYPVTIQPDIYSSHNYMHQEMYGPQVESNHETQMSTNENTQNIQNTNLNNSLHSSESSLSRTSRLKTVANSTPKITESPPKSAPSTQVKYTESMENSTPKKEDQHPSTSSEEIRKNPLLTPKNQKSRKLHDPQDDEQDYDDSASIQIPSLIVSNEEKKTNSSHSNYSNIARPPLSAKKTTPNDIMSPVTPAVRKSKKSPLSMNSSSLYSGNDDTMPRINFNPDDDDDSTTFGDLVSTPMSSTGNYTMDLDESNWLTPGAKNYLNRHKLQTFSPESPHIK